MLIIIRRPKQTNDREIWVLFCDIDDMSDHSLKNM